jgi:hypothetical protein
MKTWSYSSISLFEQCPKKYYHLRIVKDVVEPESEHLLYGKAFHLAAEEYIRDGKPIPDKFAYAKPMLEKLNKLEGEKLCEYEMGLKYVNGRFTPCSFDDPKAYCRGIADLIILDRENKEARLVDYKTSKSAQYADTKQLKLLAAMTFMHFPEIKVVKAGLLFVVANDFVKAEYETNFTLAYMQHFKPTVEQLALSIEVNTWNPKPNFSCRGWCPVNTCAHWEPKRNYK